MKHREAIACITVRRLGAPDARGTGTLVAERLVLTALHVVADRTRTPPEFFAGPISLEFPGKSIVASPVDGMWDPAADWVLLECVDAPGIEPVPLGELGTEDTDCEWETFGFPDIKPDGIRLVGEVRDPAARYQQIEAIQLYCKEAIGGARMAGASGGPCLVEGALVGVIRSALQNQGATVAGTLFACPLAAVLARAGDRLRLPDPCRGLPGLPRADLPQDPYPSLGFYAREYAEVFFGRNAAIRDLYEKITNPTGDPIVLFFGQSGVGKSSLLDAGLVPRLEASHAVRYVRRDAAKSLAPCFAAATEGDFHALEEKLKRPVVVVLDQVEEAFTRRRSGPETELKELLDALTPLFGVGGKRPRGRLVLSLRKEWLPEVAARLKERRMPYSEHFLERLDRAGVIEVVHGVTRTDRLRIKYQATVDKDLGGDIAASLIDDQGSPVAPTLQVLMTRLWETAIADPTKPRVITKMSFNTLKGDGIHLADYLRQQVERLPTELKPLVESGLVDDLLEAHTTTLGTAATLTLVELQARYPRVAETSLIPLLSALETTHLLTNPQVDRSRDKARFRLGHDTLAPLVRERFRLATQPGPRARRVLERRAGAGEVDKKAQATLDGDELRIVEKGLGGMRACTPAEAKLLRASYAARRLRRAALVLTALVVLVAGGFGARLYRDALDKEARSGLLEVQTKSDEARRLFDRANDVSDPIEALLAACRAVEVAPDDDLRLQLYIARAQHLFAEIAPMRALLSGELLRRADLSEDWTRMLVQDISGNVQIWSVDLHDQALGVQISGPPITLDVGDAAPISDARLSPDGRWALTGGGGTPLHIWNATTGESAVAVPDIKADAFFAPGSRVVLAAGGAKGQVRAAAVLGAQGAWEVGQTDDLTGHLSEPLWLADTGKLTLALTATATEKIRSRTRLTITDIVSRSAAFPSSTPVEIDNLRGVGLSRSGDYLATVSVEGGEMRRVEVWKTATGERVFKVTRRAPGDVVWGLGDDGHSVVTGGSASSIETSGLTLVSADESTSVSFLNCHPHADQAMRHALDPRDGAVLCREDGNGGQRLGRMWFSPEPRHLTVAARQTVAWWGSSDGDRIASISENGWLEVQRLKPEVAEYPLAFDKAGSIGHALFSRFADHVFTSEEHGGRLALWTGEQWNAAWTDQIPVDILPAWFVSAISRDGGHVAITSGGQILRWDVKARTHENTSTTGTVQSMVFADDGPTLLVGTKQFGRNAGAPFDVLEWAPGGKPKSLGSLGDPCQLGYTSLSIAPGAHERFAVVSSDSRRVALCRAGSKDVASIEFESDASRVLAGQLLRGEAPIEVNMAGPSNVTVRVGTTSPVEIRSILGRSVISPQGGQPYVLPHLDPGTRNLAFSASGPWIAHALGAAQPDQLGLDEGELLVSALAAGITLARLKHPARVITAAFTEDGNRLRTVARDGAVREWFIRHAYTKKPAWVSQLAAFTSGSRLVEGGAAHFVPGMLSGPGRAALIKEVSTAAAAGDRGAAFVLEHMIGKR